MYSKDLYSVGSSTAKLVISHGENMILVPSFNPFILENIWEKNLINLLGNKLFISLSLAQYKLNCTYKANSVSKYAALIV